jgi:predicted metal-dependent enzyme (double-stranded beta helix superfamily)
MALLDLDLEYTLDSLIQELDLAVAPSDHSDKVQAVRKALERATALDSDFLPDTFCVPADQGYARRLIHTDPLGRYSVMAMVWDKGQGTPLHDHNGLWVVECVYRGKVRVSNYAPGEQRDGLQQFQLQTSETAGRGVSDYRLPPFEHHILENAQDEPTITIHVFGGAMTECSVYEPVEGGWVRHEKALALTA